MALDWQCIKIGTAAARKIVPVAPWMLAAYLAAHPLPETCDVACRYVIPPAEFQPGGMFGSAELVLAGAMETKADENTDEAAPSDIGGIPEQSGDIPFSPDSPLLHPLYTEDPSGGDRGGSRLLSAPTAFLPPSLFPPPVGTPSSSEPPSSDPPTSEPIPNQAPEPDEGPLIVPEPAGVLLIATGLAGLAVFRRRRTRSIPGSVAAGQAQYMLCDVGEDQIGADRRHLVKPGFAEFALDVVFLGEPEPAMGLDAGLARRP